MKINSTIEVSATMKNVTLELSPRQAFMLRQLVGNINGCDMAKMLSSGFMENEKFPRSVHGDATVDECVQFTGQLWDGIGAVFEEAVKVGCK